MASTTINPSTTSITIGMSSTCIPEPISNDFDKRVPCYHVNIDMLPLKAAYFFTMGAFHSLFLYLSLYMKHLGFTASESSITLGCTQFTGAIVAGSIGAFADHSGQHRRIAICCAILTGLLHSGLTLVPARKWTSRIPLQCSSDGCHTLFSSNGNFGNLTNCEEISSLIKKDRIVTYRDDHLKAKINWYVSCKPRILLNIKGRETVELINYNKGKINSLFDVFTCFEEYNTTCIAYQHEVYSTVISSKDIVILCEEEIDSNNDFDIIRCYMTEEMSEYKDVTFWMFASIYFAGQITFIPIMSLIDAISYSTLTSIYPENEKKGREQWGTTRLWGSIGVSVFGLTSGILMDINELNPYKVISRYMPSFLLFICLSILVAISLYVHSTYTSIKPTTEVFKETLKLMKDTRIILLFMFVLTTGGLMGAIHSFLYWHLDDLPAINKPGVLFGMMELTNSIPEMMLFFASAYFIRHVGYVACMSIGCIAYGVRFFGYSLLVSRWYVLIIEPLNGLSFGLLYAAASVYGSQVTPSGLNGTVQGILSALHFGFGHGGGSVIFGQLVSRLGTSTTFRIAALTSLVIVILFVSLNKVINRISPITVIPIQ